MDLNPCTLVYGIVSPDHPLVSGTDLTCPIGLNSIPVKSRIAVIQNGKSIVYDIENLAEHIRVRGERDIADPMRGIPYSTATVQAILTCFEIWKDDRRSHIRSIASKVQDERELKRDLEEFPGGKLSQERSEIDWLLLLLVRYKKLEPAEWLLKESGIYTSRADWLSNLMTTSASALENAEDFDWLSRKVKELLDIDGASLNFKAAQEFLQNACTIAKSSLSSSGTGALRWFLKRGLSEGPSFWNGILPPFCVEDFLQVPPGCAKLALDFFSKCAGDAVPFTYFKETALRVAPCSSLIDITKSLLIHTVDAYPEETLLDVVSQCLSNGCHCCVGALLATRRSCDDKVVCALSLHWLAALTREIELEPQFFRLLPSFIPALSRARDHYRMLQVFASSLRTPRFPVSAVAEAWRTMDELSKLRFADVFLSDLILFPRFESIVRLVLPYVSPDSAVTCWSIALHTGRRQAACIISEARPDDIQESMEYRSLTTDLSVD